MKIINNNDNSNKNCNSNNIDTNTWWRTSNWFVKFKSIYIRWVVIADENICQFFFVYILQIYVIYWAIWMHCITASTFFSRSVRSQTTKKKKTYQLNDEFSILVIIE